MKRTLTLSLTLVTLFIGCKSEVLDGGSRVQEADDGGTEPSSDAPSSPGPGSGGRGFGERCASTAECGADLECRPFAEHHEDGSCNEVGMSCTKSCVVESDCSGLEGAPLCFLGCDGTSTCGKTSSGASDAITFTIEDAPEPLTSSKGDPLFSLTITEESPARAYRMTDMAVVVEPVGETGTIVPCTHDDANGDGNLDVGETLHCTEPPVDTFNAAHVGNPITVSLVERTKVDTYTTRGKGSWIPVN